MERLDEISEAVELEDSPDFSHDTPTSATPTLATPATPTLATPTKAATDADQPESVEDIPVKEEDKAVDRTQTKPDKHADVSLSPPSNAAYSRNLDQWLDTDLGSPPPANTDRKGKGRSLEPEPTSPSPVKEDSKSRELKPLFDDEEDMEYEFLKLTPVPQGSQHALQLMEDTPPQSPTDVTLVSNRSGEISRGQDHQVRPLVAMAFSYPRGMAGTQRKPTVEGGISSSLVESMDDPLYTGDDHKGLKFGQERVQHEHVKVTVEPPSDSSGSHKFGGSSVERTSEEPPGLGSDAAQFELSGSGDWSSSVENFPSCRNAPGMKMLAVCPLTGDSDSSRDEDGQCPLESSIVAPDFYKLCGTLVQDSSLQQRKAVSLPPRSRPGMLTSGESKQTTQRDSEDLSSGSDIWVPIPHPSRHSLQSVCLSDQLLWVIDNQGMVFYTTINSKGKDWQRMKKPFHQIASSPSGNVVWALYQQNTYVRLGVGMSPVASVWKNVTRSSPLAKSIKHIAVDENAVWVVKADGQVLFRKGVSQSNPEGKVWMEVGHAAGFSFVACCGGIVWVLTTGGKVFIREGITTVLPSGSRWTEVKAPCLSAVSITGNGVVWGLSQQDSSLGFRCGVTKGKPMGKGPWWEISLSALTHPTSPYNSLLQVMTSEGSQILAPLSSFAPLSTLGSLMSLTTQPKLLSVSASRRAGVCVLETGSKLHACWKSATGYHYTPACKDGVFQLTNWTKLAVTSNALWVVREDGELFCVTSGDKLVRVECESNVTLITASPSVLWVVTKDKIWSRQGMTPQSPEGYSWDYIELSELLDNAKLRYIVCGNQAVWAIDGNGTPYFRFGVHSREPGTGMSPAWIPVDENKSLSFLSIAVNPDNWLVWSCDENFNAYVRTGVTQDYPVGLAWDLIPDEQIKTLCAVCAKIYALTPNGDLLCRHGITERNPQGNYWRRIPGKYVRLAAGAKGELWTLDDKGQVWKQESKVLAVSLQSDTNQEEFEMSMVVDPSWEML